MAGTKVSVASDASATSFGAMNVFRIVSTPSKECLRGLQPATFGPPKDQFCCPLETTGVRVSVASGASSTSFGATNVFRIDRLRVKSACLVCNQLLSVRRKAQVGCPAETVATRVNVASEASSTSFGAMNIFRIDQLRVTGDCLEELQVLPA
jgi:hypothetical protein